MDELKSKYIGKYFGADEISDITIIDFTTPLGSVIFELTFLTGKKQIVTEKSLVLGVSDAVHKDKDGNDDSLSFLLSQRINAISEECVKIVAEYDVPSYLFDRVGLKIQAELEAHFQRASAIVWFGDTDEYAPGFLSSNNVTLLMADRINNKIPAK